MPDSAFAITKDLGKQHEHWTERVGKHGSLDDNLLEEMHFLNWRLFLFPCQSFLSTQFRRLIFLSDGQMGRFLGLIPGRDMRF